MRGGEDLGKIKKKKGEKGVERLGQGDTNSHESAGTGKRNSLEGREG